MNFSATWEIWKDVLTNPGAEVFARQRKNPDASLSVAVIWIFIAAVVVAVFAAINAVIRSALFR